MKIKSDDKTIENKLDLLVNALTKHGAWFHENLMLNCTEKSISVKMAGPCNPDEIIIKIPEKLLVPAFDFNISVEGDKFIINPDTEKLSSEQIEIGELVFELYNLADRVAFYKNESPWIRFRTAPWLLEELMKSRTSNKQQEIKRDFINKSPDSMTVEKFIAENFPMTRVFGYNKINKDKNENTESDMTASLKQVIMPVIDFMDHNHNGGSFNLGKDDNDALVLKLKNKQPIMASNDCFAFYGVYDAVDTFFNYGFIDEDAPFLRSIPVEVEIHDEEKLTIQSLLAIPNKEVHKDLEDLKPMIPIVMKNKDQSGLVASHMFITLPPRPHATRRILRAIIRTMVGPSVSEEFVTEKIEKTEKFIVEKNIDFYKELREKADKDDKTPADLKEQIKHIANVQLNRLYKYAYNSEFKAPAE
jgi:hypothetical protein